MSALDELIYDRTQTDVTYAAELNRKLGRGEALTAQELADWNAGLKGAYNAADMNRVDAAVQELGGMLTAAGYPVEYTNPRQDEPDAGSEIVLAANDFQQGVWLGASGTYQNIADYICTISPIHITAGFPVTVRTSLDISNDNAIVWYDANMQYISCSYSQGLKKIEWDGCFQGIAPDNATYCHVDINMTGITPTNVGTVYVRQESDPENALLPDGYSCVEYIESTGAEYIDTGYQASSQTKIVMKVKTTNIATAAYPAYFGTRDNGAVQNAFGLFLQKDTDVVYSQYGTQSINISSGGLLSAENSEFVTITMSNVLDVNNTIICTHQLQSFTSSQNLYLFATNDGSPYEYGTFAIGSCVIYDNDVIVRYYRPCVNDSGIAGLYDTVSGIFFVNAASDSVKPVDLPQGYTQVEYIQTSSSGGQYIDTDFIPNNNTRTVCTISNFPLTKHSQSPFGVRVSSASRAYDILASENPNDYRTDFGSQQVHFPTSLNVSGHMVIDKNKNVTIINNTSTVTASSSTFSCSGSMYLMAINNNGSASLFCESVLLYGAQIYDNGTLVRDFIPCKNSSGAIGLYDIVGNQFYANAGTGSFTAGANVSEGFTHGDVVPRPPARDYWVVGDIITMPVWTQYIQNVQNVRDAYYTMPDTPKLPEPTAPLTYDGANAIERLIYDILKLYEGMIKRYRICGTFTAGDDYNRQYIRSV